MKWRVLIINSNKQYDNMFINQNWEVMKDALTIPNLIQFTGGSDVDPHFYKQKKHSSTTSVFGRDRAEQLIFKWGLSENIPMAGICRGGQFLNVMCGGNLWQDVNEHSTGFSHKAQDIKSKEVFDVTSTHHQMMIPTKRGQLVITSNICTRREKFLPSGKLLKLTNKTGNDVEAVYYEQYNVFCFQPHPEFSSKKELSGRYFSYLDDFLL